MLFSFEARGADCIALDEPLYRQWLIDKGESAVSRPYFWELVNGEPSSDDASPKEILTWKRELEPLDQRITSAARKLLENCPDESDRVVFCKHMAKHSQCYEFDQELSLDFCDIRHWHVLLVRDPVAVLSSWGASGGVHGFNPSSDEVGIVPLLSIYSQLESRRSANPPVIVDSDELVKDPETVIGIMCSKLSIAYDTSMMSWKSGPHDCDGPWAKWWYSNVHKSVGWNRSTKIESDMNPPKQQYRTFDPYLIGSLKASLPAYEFLKGLAASYSHSPIVVEEENQDSRNLNLLLWIGKIHGSYSAQSFFRLADNSVFSACALSGNPDRGRLYPRDLARISPFDSLVQEGDACWEYLRVFKGKIMLLEKHLQHLLSSARAKVSSVANVEWGTLMHWLKQIRYHHMLRGL